MSKNGGAGIGLGCAALLIFLVIWLAVAVVGALVLMFAWNLVLPSLLGWPPLDFAMAFGLSLLISIIGGLFGRSRS